MKKVDSAVWEATRYIAAWELIFSLLMQTVFLIIGRWHYTVLTGNLLSGTAAILNFFLMGLTVQKCLGLEEKEAKTRMRASQLYRNMLMLLVLAVGVALKMAFNVWAVIIPVFFPRIAIMLKPIFDRKK